MTITSLAFLTPDNFADDDPYTGLEETLQLFVYSEELGYDGAWIRQRHLEHGVGSAAVFLTAAGSQRPQPQPHNPGLVNRIWYGGGSLRSARWAGEHGPNLLCARTGLAARAVGGLAMSSVRLEVHDPGAVRRRASLQRRRLFSPAAAPTGQPPATPRRGRGNRR
jgi:alkanesulfonate monooxygenase SsuD/methylene tetrahydromethanopterin reductase-like flavin-dependent oxidoreductase (luciferase family)